MDGPVFNFSPCRRSLCNCQRRLDVMAAHYLKATCALVVVKEAHLNMIAKVGLLAILTDCGLKFLSLFSKSRTCFDFC